MKLELNPGETLVVTFAETDGEITASYQENTLLIEADMPDDSNRGGELWKCELIDPVKPSGMQPIPVCGNLSPAPLALRCTLPAGHSGPHHSKTEEWTNKGRARCEARDPRKVNAKCRLPEGHEGKHEDAHGFPF